jgi:hypothetical protein
MSRFTQAPPKNSLLRTRKNYFGREVVGLDWR